MATRILGIEIGHTEIKAVLAETTWKNATVLGVYAERVPEAAEVAHRLPPAEPHFPAKEEMETADVAGESVELSEELPAKLPEETPPPWVFAVDDLLRKQALKFDEVHCALPGGKTTTRILTLPFENRRRIEQVLPFELENLVPFNLEDMHLTFEVLGKAAEGGFRVLVAMTPKEELHRFLLRLAQAGIDPKIVEISPYALYGAARQYLPEELGALAVGDLGATHTDLAVLREGELQELRTFSFGSERLDRALVVQGKTPEEAERWKIESASLKGGGTLNETIARAIQPFINQLRQTLHGLRSERNLDVTRLFLTGRGSLLAGLDDVLAQELSVEVVRLCPLTSATAFSADERNPTEQARYAGALALVQHGFGQSRQLRLNLRHGPFVQSRQKLALQSSIRSFAAIGVIIALLLVYNLVAGQVQKRKHFKALDQEIVKVYTLAFPTSPFPQMPVEQFRGQISKAMEKFETVSFFGEANQRAVDVIKAISKELPVDVKVDIKKFDLTSEALKLEGLVNEYPEVDRLEKTFKEMGLFKQVKGESSKGAKDKVKFNFYLALTEKKAKRPAATGKAPKAATAKVKETE